MYINVTTYSLKDFKNTIFNDTNVDDFNNDYFICINSSGGIHSVPHFNEEHKNVLNMYFDDVNEDTVKYYGPTDSEFPFNAKACTNSQSKNIYNFIEKIPNNSKLHIYCTKGKSRSVAVAKFVNENINKIQYLTEGHNTLVYELLCLNLK
jgi:predicted protein tyrosine phosphatase